MDDDRQPQRIEVELTSREPSAVRRSAVPVVDGAGAGDDPEPVGPGGPRGTERGRLVMVGIASGAVALVLGFLVGQMSADEDAVADDPAETSPTTVRAPTTTMAGSTVTLPGALPLPAPAPTTITNRTATTATLDTSDTAPPTTGAIAVHPAAAAIPVEVVVTTVRGDLVRVDAATGRTITSPVAASQFGPPFIQSGDGWVLVPSFDEARGSTVLFDDGTRATVDAGTSWPPLQSSAAGTFWRFAGEDPGTAPTELVEVSLDGLETGRTIELDGFYPQFVDPIDGVVVIASGGAYTRTPDSTTRITGGQLIALGRERAVVNECDEALVCGYFVVDRASGERTAISLDTRLAAGQSLDSGWWLFRSPLSPDETAVLVSYWPIDGIGQQSFGIMDLATGRYQEVGTSVDTPTMDWSPDGRQVFWLDRGRLRVFDRATEESVLFSEELGTINAFSIRPASPSFDGTVPPGTDAAAADR